LGSSLLQEGTAHDTEHAEHRPVTTPVTALDDAVTTLRAAAVRVGAEQSAHSLRPVAGSRAAGEPL
jgi:hypothetical protein